MTRVREEINTQLVFSQKVFPTSIGGAKTKSRGWCSSCGGGSPKTRSRKS